MSKNVSKSYVKQIVVHPRYECTGGCTNCYLTRDMVGSKGDNSKERHIIEVVSAFTERVQALEYGDPNKYEEIQLCFMLNCSNGVKEWEDILTMETLFYIYSLSAAMFKYKLGDISIYINNKMIIDRKYMHTVEKLISTLDNLAIKMQPVNGFKIWISDAFGPNWKMLSQPHSAQLIDELMRREMCNFTVNITESTDIDKIEQMIRALHKTMSRSDTEYIVYINIIDDKRGNITKAKNRAAKLYHIMAKAKDAIYPVELDSCVTQSLIKDCGIDIEHIFPNGTVRNCPYIPYTRNMNDILNEEYCGRFCPRK